MPTAKNDASVRPSAESSLILVVCFRVVTSNVPATPAITAPAKISAGFLVMLSTSKLQSNNPLTLTPENRKPSATPGNTACDNVSPTSAILRTTIKQPSNPHEMPSNTDPNTA